MYWTSFYRLIWWSSRVCDLCLLSVVCYSDHNWPIRMNNWIQPCYNMELFLFIITFNPLGKLSVKFRSVLWGLVRSGTDVGRGGLVYSQSSSSFQRCPLCVHRGSVWNRYGPLVLVMGNLMLQHRHSTQLHASNFVSLVWRRPAYGCDGHVSTNFWPFGVFKAIVLPCSYYGTTACC